MFAIANGRKALWQWDLNQQLTVAGSCTEVHYLDKGALSTLTVAVKDGKADIPNVLLQRPGRLVVYAYIVDAQDHHTKICETFGISARPKPDDYVYTETEVKTWSNLQSQIGDLADLETEAKENLVAAVNEAARSGGGGSAENAVLYTEQNLTYAQREQARANINAVGNEAIEFFNSEFKTHSEICKAYESGKVCYYPYAGTKLMNNAYSGRMQPFVFSGINGNNEFLTVTVNTDDSVVQGDRGIYNLTEVPQATAEAIGGVKADSAEAADTQPVRIGEDGKLYTAPGGTDISLGITSAAVGQTIKVKAVDENGKPTAWDAADMPSGGGAGLWEHICDITTTEEIDGGITISENREGVPLPELQYNEIWVLAKMVGISTNTNNWWVCTCGIHQKEGDELYLSRTNGASYGGTTATRYVSWYTFIRGGKAYWTDGEKIDPYDITEGNQAWLDNFLDKYTFDYFTDVTISSDSTRVIGVDTEIRILGRRA